MECDANDFLTGFVFVPGDDDFFMKNVDWWPAKFKREPHQLRRVSWHSLLISWLASEPRTLEFGQAQHSTHLGIAGEHLILIQV